MNWKFPAIKRRTVIAWGLRLLLGVALGVGLRLAYEQRPGARFAVGMALRTLEGAPAGAGAGGRKMFAPGGEPLRFSLDEIMAAENPAEALRAWREAFAQAPPSAQQQCLAARVEASPSALRKVIAGLASSSELRDEIVRLSEDVGQGQSLEMNEAMMKRVFAELARTDPGLAIDGAEAGGIDEIKRFVWAIIAEDNPHWVLEMVQAGQAPASVRADVLASLVIRSPEEAFKMVMELPENVQERSWKTMMQALAAQGPIAALSYGKDASGKIDPDWAETLADAVPITKARALLLALEKDHPDLLATKGARFASLLSRVAREDPALALRGLETRQHTNEPLDSHTAQALAGMAEKDPEGMRARVAAWPEGKARSSAVAALGFQWMQQEPLAALRWMAGQRLHMEGIASGYGVVQSKGFFWEEKLAPEQFSEAAALLENAAGEPGGDSLAQFPALGNQLLQRWAKTDPAAAYAWVANTPLKLSSFAKREVLAWWLHKDVQAAAPVLQDAASRDPGLVPQMLRFNSPQAPAISGSSLEPARQWLWQHLPELAANETTREVLGKTSVEKVAGTAMHSADPRAALAAISAVPDAVWRGGVMETLGQNLAHDLPRARQFAASASDPATADRIMEAAIQARMK